MVMDKILFETNKVQVVDIEFLKNKSEKIFDNITRIKNIIDHVRAFSRSDDNYVLTAFDINSSIENAVSMILEQFKHLDINLQTHLSQNIPQLVGNTYKFEQVIVNLLTNAKDAVLEKRIRQQDYCDLKVEIGTYQENQSLIVEITDNGIGIDKDDIHNIMLPFYTTKEEGKGTGLGLSICYQIIKEMNGVIDISSDGITGTKIRLILDIQKPN
jgi:signal transduction histidine kinase